MKEKAMKPIKILIADDHAIVREGIRQLLTSQNDMEIVGEADDGSMAIKRVKSLKLHLLDAKF